MIVAIQKAMFDAKAHEYQSYQGLPDLRKGIEKKKKNQFNVEVDFNTATAIKCVLQQSRRIDDTGKIYITLNKVITVIEVITSNNAYETNQEKKYKKQRKENPIQLKMNLE